MTDIPALIYALKGNALAVVGEDELYAFTNEAAAKALQELSEQNDELAATATEAMRLAVLAVTATALDGTCSMCGAKPGAACYGNGPMRTPHPGREANARKQVAAQLTQLQSSSPSAALTSRDEAMKAEGRAELLAEMGAGETRHKVSFRPGHSTVEHPYSEQINGELLSCTFHLAIALSGPPKKLSTYWVDRNPRDGSAVFEEIPAGSEG